MNKKKTLTLVFTRNNAVTRTNHDSPPEGALINPDLSKVRGVRREFWKLSRKGEVVEMSRPEKLLRLADIELHGADNSAHAPTKPTRHFIVWTLLILSFLAGVSVGVIV